MLTKKDLKLIEQILEINLEAKLEEKFTEKLKHLPTKEEFYTKMDALMKELKGMREEITTFGYRQFQHTDQLKDHEKRLIKLGSVSSAI